MKIIQMARTILIHKHTVKGSKKYPKDKLYKRKTMFISAPECKTFQIKIEFKNLNLNTYLVQSQRNILKPRMCLPWCRLRQLSGSPNDRIWSRHRALAVSLWLSGLQRICLSRCNISWECLACRLTGQPMSIVITMTLSIIRQSWSQCL